ncbi:ImmA/IrrE family metallo-endopeptidase [Hoeflea sp.]|uniref:ImmA/IrrE family metallo-endopeptidase n=1 Tax=Hoeflea sp. TaxID=1940281 RepID=UPI003B023670
MTNTNQITWTNKSVLSFAGNIDPIKAIERATRDLVNLARQKGWSGPPFNPVFIAKLLNIQIEANTNIADARTISSDGDTRIEYNPRQARERVRFSIAHEIAHLLFPDAAERVRNRGGTKDIADDWQLELLCNLAASEFVMPFGSLASKNSVSSIEELMVERRKFDVSAEAFLTRIIHGCVVRVAQAFESRYFSVNDAESSSFTDRPPYHDAVYFHLARFVTLKRQTDPSQF